MGCRRASPPPLEGEGRGEGAAAPNPPAGQATPRHRRHPRPPPPHHIARGVIALLPPPLRGRVGERGPPHQTRQPAKPPRATGATPAHRHRTTLHGVSSRFSPSPSRGERLGEGPPHQTRPPANHPAPPAPAPPTATAPRCKGCHSASPFPSRGERLGEGPPHQTHPPANHPAPPAPPTATAPRCKGCHCNPRHRTKPARLPAPPHRTAPHRPFEPATDRRHRSGNTRRRPAARYPHPRVAWDRCALSPREAPFHPPSTSPRPDRHPEAPSPPCAAKRSKVGRGIRAP